MLGFKERTEDLKILKTNHRHIVGSFRVSTRSVPAASQTGIKKEAINLARSLALAPENTRCPFHNFSDLDFLKNKFDIFWMYFDELCDLLLSAVL